MYTYYNMNQLTLDITTSYVPEENSTAHFINDLVEALKLREAYLFGRPRSYNLSVMLKLVLFAYTRETYSSRKIERLAKESLPARWLTQEQFPSYRTIARFRISEELQGLINQGLIELTTFLRKQKLVDDTLFIDGTKILADANKYSFVWKKNTLRFEKMNKAQITAILPELIEAYQLSFIPEGSEMNLEMLEEIITQLEIRLEDLEKQVTETEKISPNPAKKKRRKLKSHLRKIKERKQKMVHYETDHLIFGARNSYSKTDHDATFMRVKEDPMKNGQLKPAYNLQIATSNQFILNYDIFQNPTDTRTLIPFLNKMKLKEQEPKIIVADAGYGSESNYRYIEDELSQHTALIPYGMMRKEQSKKWKSDEQKVTNWVYNETEDFYTDSKNVRFLFNAYRTRKDKYGFIREFKEYRAETLDGQLNLIPYALTPKGNPRTININSSWEYFKVKQNEQLSSPELGKVYAQRKIDVEPVFGRMKAYLGFTRFSVRGIEKVKNEIGLVSLALNMIKLAALGRLNSLKMKNKKGNSIKNHCFNRIPFFCMF